MNAPLYEALCALAEKNDLRMHMPGHKGKSASPFFSVSAIDYTEIPTTGNLYLGEGPIGQAEELAAKAWGAAHAYFLTGGSTQGIMTGLSLCAAPGSKILLDRNTHKSFFNGCALLDLRPVYLREPTAEGVEKRLTAQKDIKAVCITSPTYYGVILDVAGIGAVCRRCGVENFWWMRPTVLIFPLWAEDPVQQDGVRIFPFPRHDSTACPRQQCPAVYKGRLLPRCGAGKNGNVAAPPAPPIPY